MAFRFTLVVCFVSYLTNCAGCAPSSTAPVAPGGSGSAGQHQHGHDHHGHDHGHAHHGLHDGHLIEVGNEEYHLEWTHDDATGKVTVFVVDGQLKNDVKIAAKDMEINVKIGEKSTVFKLAPVNASGDPPMASEFQAIDKSLIEGIRMSGHGVVTTTALEIGGKTFTVEFKH